MVVPGGHPWAPLCTRLPQVNSAAHPASAAAGLVARETRETAAMLGSASPRNPRVGMASSRSGESSLLVAWRSKASVTSSAAMPAPSSVTRICSMPPPLISTIMREAPASREFSTNSLTTDTGRSTTSPAAIWAASSAGSCLIGMGIVLTAPCVLPPAKGYGCHCRRATGGRGMPVARQKRGNTVPLALYCVSSEVPSLAKSHTIWYTRSICWSTLRAKK